ncbi:MAG: hypothetical protein R2822_01915 [Spirosomataceae bacterium]
MKESFQKTLFIRKKSNDERGWILDIMNCIDLIPNEKFTLNDIYKFENTLKMKHPQNNFIKDKIRQQLQLLRDKGIIEFISRGCYKKTKMKRYIFLTNEGVTYAPNGNDVENLQVIGIIENVQNKDEALKDCLWKMSG